MNKNIFVFGLGYVGMSLATLFATNHTVYAFDIDPKKVNQVRNKKSTVLDADIQTFLDTKNLNLTAVDEPGMALREADYVLVCTPTNFDIQTQQFDTSSVDHCVMQAINASKKSKIIVKSTIPIGHTAELQKKLDTDRIAFCPEFLQEGTALRDNLRPERIVVGSHKKYHDELSELFLSICADKRVPLIHVETTEAEAVKLFANSFLAMRIAFFNELDSYAFKTGLDASQIIKAISCDARIGNYYNNPSFGFGGYCLPKDVSQLEYEVSNKARQTSPIISSIRNSNDARKKAIINYILRQNITTVGIYRLSMKQDSDNFREAAVFDIMQELISCDHKVLIYEPSITEKVYGTYHVESDFDLFVKKVDLIIANRTSSELSGIDKVLTRDIFGTN